MGWKHPTPRFSAERIKEEVAVERETFEKNYKDKRIVGIYMITCLVNDLIYIGSSGHIHRRWYTHLVDLIEAVHGNYRIQHDFERHGKFSFKIEVLWQTKEPIHRNELYVIEQTYIDHYQPEYNIKDKVDFDPKNTLLNASPKELENPKISGNEQRRINKALQKLHAARRPKKKKLRYKHLTEANKKYEAVNARRKNKPKD